jgi:hypothetical protein
MEQLEDPEKTPVPQDVVEKDKTRATTIKRSNSISSSASSGAASANSANSSASGKRIVPLYNLSVHNVMHPTAVTDAGTDSKVAKVSVLNRPMLAAHGR